MNATAPTDLPDLIVVGGGSAGCAMAARLAEAGRSVLLLEAGKSDDTLRLRIPALSYSVVANPEYDWGYLGEADASVVTTMSTGGPADRRYVSLSLIGPAPRGSAHRRRRSHRRARPR